MTISGVNGYSNFITVNHRSLMRKSEMQNHRNTSMQAFVFNPNNGQNRYASGATQNINYSSLTSQYAQYMNNSSSSTDSKDSGLDLNWKGAVGEGVKGFAGGFITEGMKSAKDGDWKSGLINGALGAISGLFSSKSS